MRTIKDILTKYHKKLDSLDLELLIANSIKKPREFVLAHPEFSLSSLKIENLIRRLAKKIARRRRGEPLAYILGHKEFFGLDFKVNRHTLIPRPETEMLVEEVLKLDPKNKTVIDIGTGSGNIIISLIKNLKNKNKFIATDISANALKVAKQNARIHKVSGDIKFIKSDLLDYFLEHPALIKKDCVIIANLPYLDLGWKTLLKSSETKGLKFEPRIALYAGEDGLDAYRQLAGQLKKMKSVIKNKITILCEIGHIQKKGMENMFSFANKASFKKDLAGKWRVCQISL
ncbi:MAG: peptide chain release factor N(5)-glutamine methyltransferase [Parcubacteria group bacterium]